jgi:cerevisin
MLSSFLFTAFAATLSLIFENAAPASARRLSGSNSSIENSYIVKLKDGVNTTSHINSLPFLFSIEDPNSPVTHYWPKFFKGYSGIFVGATLDAILASPDVKYVEKNRIVRFVALSLTLHILNHTQVRVSDSQTNTPWNLQAISTTVPVGGTDPSQRIYTYSYDQPAGGGVDVYVVDTGVYIEHQEFGGRATFGWFAPGLKEEDDSGHGTHVAGIIAGSTYGVAKNANIIAVKVFDSSPESDSAQVVEGINWVSANVEITKKPSIACMAFNSDDSGPIESINDAIVELIAHGVAVVVSAGNDGKDASTNSPASVTEALVIAASDITNTMWPSSNYGRVVDVFAPGVDIISAWIDGPLSTNYGSGTSMSAAHVAGIVACFLSADTGLDPAALSSKIYSLMTQNVIIGVPVGTYNDLVFNGHFD